MLNDFIEKNNQKKQNTQQNQEINQASVEKAIDNENINNKEDMQQNNNLDKVNELQKVISELNNKLLNSLAEAENMRKRFAKELQDAKNYAISDMARDMVLLKENFRIAKSSIDKELLTDEHVIAVYKGIDMMDKLFDEMLKSYDIKQIIPKGEVFDHNYHQAVSRIKSNDYKEGIIIDVIRSGYVLKDRLLAPAIVTVSDGSDSVELENK